MVGQIETIARIHEAQKGAPNEFSRDLLEVVKKHRELGDAPEVLEGVVLYDRSSKKKRIYSNSDFDHDQLERHLIFKEGSRKGKIVKFTRTENKFMEVFEEYENEILSKSELSDLVHGKESTSHNISQFIYYLRKKVGAEYILTLRGVGYKFIGTRIGLNSSQEVEKVHSHSGFTHYPDRRTVLVYGKETTLKLAENKMLDLLVENSGRIVTYEMFRVLWKNKNVNPISILRRNISTLRDILEPDKNEGEFQYLLNVKGIGYRLIDPRREDKPIPLTKLS